jgi:hypothetical protein
MRLYVKLSFICLFLLGSPEVIATDSPDACAKISKICEQAGFRRGGTKIGRGLRRHCLSPLVQGVSFPGSLLPLPKIEKNIIENCKKSDPNFPGLPDSPKK